jgi:hypothetical protein
MRTFELSRVQTAHQRGARFLHGADLSSSSQQLPLFGIGARGFWTAKEDIEPRFFVLASYAAGEEPGEVSRRYMQSTEFANDIRDFDVSGIVDVESTILIPSTSSPFT